jgi:hypothetical protein
MPQEQPDASQKPGAETAEISAERLGKIKEQLSGQLEALAQDSTRGVRIAHLTGTERSGAHMLEASDSAGDQSDHRYDVDGRLIEKAETVQEMATQRASADSPDRAKGKFKTVAITTDGKVGTGEITMLGASEDVEWGEAGNDALPDTGIQQTGRSMSGWSPMKGYEQGTEAARALAATGELRKPDGSAFDFPRHPYDGKEKNEKGDPIPVPGRFAASHAETQQMALHLPEARSSAGSQPVGRGEIAPVEQIYGVSRPQCIDCRAFADVMATRYDATIIVTGPDASRIFYNDGSVGVHVNGDEAGRIYIFRREDAWETWQALLDSTAWSTPGTYEKTIP